MFVCWSAEDVVAALSTLPSRTLLPIRTVLVPNSRVGAALRGLLARGATSELLAGTRFVTPDILASAVLRRSNVIVDLTEEELREVRISQLVAEGIDPPGFGRSLLQNTVGWAEAFTATIGELERAGLRPDDLAANDPRIAGIRVVWEASDAAAKTSWTAARAIAHATRMLVDGAARLDDEATVLAVVTPDVDAGTARFIRSLPRSSVALLAARPLRASFVDRMSALFGDDARDALVHACPPLSRPNDLGIAATHLFAFEQGPGATDRPRAGARPDGSLSMEEFGGVSEEIDAAADWVVRRILAGTPLDRIAVLAPLADPWCSLLAARLREVGPDTPGPPVRVVGGLPLLHSAAGARVRTVVRALREHLHVEALVDVLCCLRAREHAEKRPSRASIRELVVSLGTRGGSPARPNGAFEWLAKLEQAELRLSAPSPIHRDEDREYGVRRRDHMLATARAVHACVSAICGMAAAVADGVTLAEFRPLLVGFLRDRLALPGLGPRLPALLDEYLVALAQDTTCAALAGPAVLDLVERLLVAIRVDDVATDGAVYIGSVASAAGLSFDAVRIVGLAEGSIPTTVRGDPVLSDDLRRGLDPLLSTGVDRALSSLQAFDLVVRGTTTTLSLSTSRLALDRTLREPSSIFVEIGAALGRPSVPAEIVPSVDSLRATDIGPALARRERELLSAPCRPGDWLDRFAAGAADGVADRAFHPSVDLRRMLEQAPGDEWHALDGAIGHEPGPVIAGLEPSHPTSAWRIDSLLQCPHRFLYQHVFRWEPPIEIPPGHELDAPTFGRLVHGVAESFFRTHGPAFAARQGSLESWRDAMRELSAVELSRLLVTHGLDSDMAGAALLQRLQSHADRLIVHLWDAGPRRHLATEWSFGHPEPVRLPTAGGDLYVRGRVDLVEADDDATIVLDIKTGKCTPRQGRDDDPSPQRDLQLAVYAHVLAARGAEPGRARVGAAYVHTDDRNGSERAFFGRDADALLDAGRDWLAAARDLLDARMFPRSPDPSDCRHCPFRFVCSDEMRDRSVRLLADRSTGALLRFRALKGER